MKLTGKAKELFMKWLNTKEQNNKSLLAIAFDIDCDLDAVPNSMKFGVLVDFFEEYGYTIVEDVDWHFPKIQLKTDKNIGKKTYGFYVFKGGEEPADYHCFFNTRNEARIKAIEVANELLNDKIR